MANRIMQVLFQLKGQIDGSVGNSFSAMAQKSAAASREIKELQRNLQKIKYNKDKYDTVSLQQAIDMNRKMNDLIRKRARMQDNLNRQSRYNAALGNLGSKASEFAQAVAPIAAIGAAIGTTVTSAMDFQKQMSRVKAIANLEPDKFEAVTAKAEEMGAKLPFTTLEAGKAFEYMAMAGWDAQAMLDGIEPVMKLAMASGEDLGTVSDIVTDAMTAFGLKADESERFANVLAQAASNANTNVGLMGNTFQYVAPLAGAMKYSIEDMSLAIGMMANMGIKGEKAGTALRSTLSRLDEVENNLGIKTADDTGKMRPFRDILVEIREAFAGMTDHEKTNMATTIAGREAMSGFLALVNTSDEDMNKLAQSLDNSNGAVNRMADTMLDNASGAWTKFKSAIDVASIAIGNAFLPTVKNVMNYLADKVGVIGEYISKNQGLVQAVGVFVSVLGGLILAWKAAAVAMALFSLVTSACPLTWIVTAISAVVAAAWYFYNNWNVVTKALSDAWQWVKDNILAIGNKIIEFYLHLPEYVAFAIGYIIGYILSLPEKFQEMVTSVGEWLYQIPQKCMEAGQIFVKNADSWAADAYNAVINWISKIPDALANYISSSWEGVKGKFAAGFSVGAASNATGGIYGKGAFLTTFAEDSGESAIPHTPNARNIGLLARTNEIMGNPLGGNNYNISIPITVNGSADSGAAQDITARVEAAVRKALDNINNQQRRVSYA